MITVNNHQKILKLVLRKSLSHKKKQVKTLLGFPATLWCLTLGQIQDVTDEEVWADTVLNRR